MAQLSNKILEFHTYNIPCHRHPNPKKQEPTVMTEAGATGQVTSVKINVKLGI